MRLSGIPRLGERESPEVDLQINVALTAREWCSLPPALQGYYEVPEGDGETLEPLAADTELVQPILSGFQVLVRQVERLAHE